MQDHLFLTHEPCNVRPVLELTRGAVRVRRSTAALCLAVAFASGVSLTVWVIALWPS
jgi:hypothetical protein